MTFLTTTSSIKCPLIAALLVITATPCAFGWEETCTQFKNIYADGTELCEKMWADSFEVVDDDTQEPAYTMWFFNQESNPNDAVTRQLFGGSEEENAVPDQCHLQYFHKDTPAS